MLGTASTSGCLESLTTIGEARSNRPAVPAATTPDYRTWLPAPSALAGDFDPTHLVHAIPGQTDETGTLFSFGEQMIRTRTDWFGHGYAHYDRAVWIDGSTVLEGDVDRSVAASAILGTSYESDGRYGNYDLYSRTDAERTVAVGDDAIVFSQGEAGKANVTAILDAADGRIDRCHEVDRAFARLVEASGGRSVNWFAPTDGEFIEAIATDVDDDTYYHVRHRLYADEAAIDERQIERTFDRDATTPEPRNTSVHGDGRLLTIVQEFDPEGFPEPDFEDEWPQVTWGVDHDEAAARLDVHHEAGNSIDADLLTVQYLEYGGNDDPERLFTETETQFADRYDTVESGDTLTVDLSKSRRPQEVQVVFSPGDGSNSLLFDYHLD